MNTEQSRVEQRKSLLKSERREIRRLHSHFQEKIENHIDALYKDKHFLVMTHKLMPLFIEEEKQFIEMENGVREGSVNSQDLCSFLKKSMIEIKTLIDPQNTMKIPEVPDEVLMCMSTSAYTLIKKEMERRTQSLSEKFKIYLKKLKNLFEYVARRTDEEFVSLSIRKNLMTAFQAYQRTIESSKSTIDSLEQLRDSLYKAIEGEESQVFVDTLEKFHSALKKHNLQVSRERLQRLAHAMGNDLERRVQLERGEANFFDAAEKAMLRFSFYQSEHQRVLEEEITDHERYLSFLEDEARITFEELKGSGREANLSSLQKLRKRGYVSDEECAYLEKILIKLYERLEKPSQQTKPAQEEDRTWCRDWLREEYGLSAEIIGTLLPHISSDDLDKTDNALRSIVHTTSLARALVKANPYLLLMSEREIGKYTAALQKTIKACQKYKARNNKGDDIQFDIEQTPENFASLEQLVGIQQKLETGKNTEIIDNSSPLEGIKQKVEQCGFNADRVLQVLHGFWYKGHYFINPRSIHYDTIIKNIRKREGEIDEGEIERTIRLLRNEGVILDNNGLSLNVHPREIRSSALQKMLSYVRANPPTY